MDRLGPITKRVLHVILVLFWTVVILGAFVAQIISCFRRDKVPYNNHSMWLCASVDFTSGIIMFVFAKVFVAVVCLLQVITHLSYTVHP